MRLFATCVRSIASLLLIAACGRPTPHLETSEPTDIGLINTQTAAYSVLYLDAGDVVLKGCAPTTPLPLTRACAADAQNTMKIMPYAEFSALLPFDSGAFPRTREGLRALEVELAEARAQADQGNEEARREAERLARQKAQMERVLSILEALASDLNLSLRQYQDDFAAALAPFQQVARVTVNGQAVMVRFLETIEARRGLGYREVSALCQERFGAAWESAPVTFSKVGGHFEETRIPDAFGADDTKEAVNTILHLNLPGTQREGMYLINVMVEGPNYPLPVQWNYNLNANDQADLFVIIVGDDTRRWDAYCARTAP